MGTKPWVPKEAGFRAVLEMAKVRHRRPLEGVPQGRIIILAPRFGADTFARALELSFTPRSKFVTQNGLTWAMLANTRAIWPIFGAIGAFGREFEQSS